MKQVPRHIATSRSRRAALALASCCAITAGGLVLGTSAPAGADPPEPPEPGPPCSTSVTIQGSFAAVEAECSEGFVQVTAKATVDGVTVRDSDSGQGSASASVDGGSGSSCTATVVIRVDGEILTKDRTSSGSC